MGLELPSWTGRGLSSGKPEAAPPSADGQSAGNVVPDAVGRDLLAWGRRYLPEHFVRPPSRMHLWLADKLQAMRETRGMKVNVLGPRGSAKSTIGTLAFPLRAALEGDEPYIWIVSDTRHQAHTHLENIKIEILENGRLESAYPGAAGRGPTWRTGAIVLRNGVAIEAYGTGQRLRGRRRQAHRPTLIVCDDLQNDDHIRSAVQREASSNWFHGMLLKAGTRKTNFLNLATALHREALALRLFETPGWDSQKFCAIQVWPENMTVWKEWEQIYTEVGNARYREAAREFFDAHRPAMEAGAEVLWPEEEDLYFLMCMRAADGSAAFEREKQCSPANPDQCEWPADYFADHIWFDSWPARLRVRTMALDPSKGSGSRHGDYAALVMLGVDGAGLVYVEADLGRRPTPQIVAHATAFVARFRPDVFAVEANQFQELLVGEFAAEFRRQGLLAPPPLPLENHVAKEVRIRRLGPYLAGRQLRFKSGSPGTRLLVEQLREFPTAAHDDGPDALEMAIRLAADLLKPPLDDGLGDRLPLEL